MKSLRWRVISSIFVLLISIAYILPSIPMFRNSQINSILPDSVINLGLDLKGGIHLTLSVDVEKAVSNALSMLGQNLRSEALKHGILILHTQLTDENSLSFTLPRAEQAPTFINFIEKNYPQIQLKEPITTDISNLKYRAYFKPQEENTIKNMAVDQVIRTIRNRVDQFGVSEPDIRKQEGYRIQIQLPGLTDSSRAVQLIGQTAQLTFHIVREDIQKDAPLPIGVSLYPQVLSNMDGTTQEILIPLNRDPVMTGDVISDARPSFDGNTGKALVALTFNQRGSKLFERITSEHVKQRLAIVLDGKVYSAPVIQERITGGHASISGNFSNNEAQDLSIILRLGSLPAPVTILEERSIGPSLGEESIKKGILAGLIGGLAVIIIMPIYYGISGLLADAMLFFTITLLLSGLAAFGATLTLPGIAGIVLTIGMSVDANVLIFERIREELRKGLKPIKAVHAGFNRASISIMDSNITTVIAAAILYQFGTGPVKGFAVTLTLGILASMFTAIFVSQTIFSMWLHKKNHSTLSI